jgi:hypothetical protein
VIAVGGSRSVLRSRVVVDALVGAVGSEAVAATQLAKATITGYGTIDSSQWRSRGLRRTGPMSSRKNAHWRVSRDSYR